jgi:TatA/E family protein of Tat protein translocase
MFDLGMQELIVIFAVALLVFGPKKLPELSRTLGKGIRELKIALRGVKDSFNDVESRIEEEISGEVKSEIREKNQGQEQAESQDKEKPYQGGGEETKDKEENG